MNGCDFLNVIQTIQDNLEGFKNALNIDTFIRILASPSADNFKLCPIHYKNSSWRPCNHGLQARKHTLTSEWGNCMHERPQAVIASCVKARSKGSVVNSVAGPGEESQKMRQFLAFDAKWGTFWAPLYLKIVNDNY